MADEWCRLTPMPSSSLPLHAPYSHSHCLSSLSATSQWSFSLRTNQPPILFFRNKLAPATSQTNKPTHFPPPTHWCRLTPLGRGRCRKGTKADVGARSRGGTLVCLAAAWKAPPPPSWWCWSSVEVGCSRGRRRIRDRVSGSEAGVGCEWH